MTPKSGAGSDPLALSALTTPLRIADAAVAPAIRHAGVRRIVGMALRAARLAGIHGSKTRPSQTVDSVGNGLKVSRIDAASIPAQVVEVEALWNGADQQLIDDPCRLEVFVTHREVPIAVGPLAGPFPAAFALADLRPQALLDPRRIGGMRLTYQYAFGGSVGRAAKHH